MVKKCAIKGRLADVCGMKYPENKKRKCGREKMLGFWSMYIQNPAILLEPLSRLKKNVKFIW
jgi:hypothetical protein